MHAFRFSCHFLRIYLISNNHRLVTMESCLKKSNNKMVLAVANCFAQFALPLVHYIGSSSNMRATCITVSNAICKNATTVKVLPYQPDDCSSADAQAKIFTILNNRPLMRTLDISEHVLYDIFISFGWILYKKFPQLHTLLMLGDCNAIITMGDITDFYASFRPQPMLSKKTAIEIIQVALHQRDFMTIQSFCCDPDIQVDLLNIVRSSHSFACEFVELEAPERDHFEAQFCNHAKNRLLRKYFRVILSKKYGMWMIHEVVYVSLCYNFCEKCWF